MGKYRVVSIRLPAGVPEAVVEHYGVPFSTLMRIVVTDLLRKGKAARLREGTTTIADTITLALENMETDNDGADPELLSSPGS